MASGIGIIYLCSGCHYILKLVYKKIFILLIYGSLAWINSSSLLTPQLPSLFPSEVYYLKYSLLWLSYHTWNHIFLTPGSHPSSRFPFPLSYNSCSILIPQNSSNGFTLISWLLQVLQFKHTYPKIQIDNQHRKDNLCYLFFDLVDLTQNYFQICSFI